MCGMNWGEQKGAFCKWRQTNGELQCLSGKGGKEEEDKSESPGAPASEAHFLDRPLCTFSIVSRPAPRILSVRESYSRPASRAKKSHAFKVEDDPLFPL